MDRIEYNVRLIILGLIGIVGIIAVASVIIREGRVNGWFPKHFLRFQNITKIAGGLIAIAFLVYTVCGVAYKDTTVSNLKIMDIVHNGSLAGAMDTYTLYLEQKNQEELVVQTMLFSAKKLNISLEQLEIGDTITIKYATGTNTLYYVEEITQ